VDGGGRHAPNPCSRRRRRNSLKPGMEIVVPRLPVAGQVVHPGLQANGRDITFPDGRKAFMGSSGTGAPKDNADPNEPK